MQAPLRQMNRKYSERRKLCFTQIYAPFPFLKDMCSTIIFQIKTEKDSKQLQSLKKRQKRRCLVTLVSALRIPTSHMSHLLAHPDTLCLRHSPLNAIHAIPSAPLDVLVYLEWPFSTISTCIIGHPVTVGAICLCISLGRSCWHP